MSPHERWNALLERLARDGRVSVNDIASEFAVSSATIRRDLDKLAQQQMLTRTRGGAIAGVPVYPTRSMYQSTGVSPSAQRIGEAAAALIPAGSTVGLNGGPVTVEVARGLGDRCDLRARPELPAVTVVTNALNIATELVVRRHIKVVVTGGVARSQSYDLLGPLAGPLLDDVVLDLAILSVDALDVDSGAAAGHEDDAAIGRMIVNRAREVVVAAEERALGRGAFARICPIERVDTLVTDAGQSEVIDAFAAAGVRVIRV